MRPVLFHQRVIGLISAVFLLTGACADVDVSLDVAESFVLDSTALTNGGTTLEIDLGGKIPASAEQLEVKNATLTQFEFAGTCTGISSSDISLNTNLISVDASVADAGKSFFTLAMPKGLSALKADPKVGALLKFMPCTNLFESNAQTFQLNKSQLETINKTLTNWKTFGEEVRTKPLLIKLSPDAGIPEGDWRINGTLKATIDVTFGFGQ